MALYLPEEENRRQGRRHKTPSELMRQMLAILIHWFPDRQFIFAGDGGYGTHASGQLRTSASPSSAPGDAFLQHDNPIRYVIYRLPTNRHRPNQCCEQTCHLSTACHQVSRIVSLANNLHNSSLPNTHRVYPASHKRSYQFHFMISYSVIFL